MLCIVREKGYTHGEVCMYVCMHVRNSLNAIIIDSCPVLINVTPI